MNVFKGPTFVNDDRAIVSLILCLPVWVILFACSWAFLDIFSALYFAAGLGVVTGIFGLQALRRLYSIKN